MAETIARLVEITGVSEEMARELLDINNYNLEQAVNFHLEARGNSHNDDFPPIEPSVGNTSESNHEESPALSEEPFVRAPIPSRSERLVVPDDDNFRQRKRRAPQITVCPLRNFSREAEMQEAQLTKYLDNENPTSSQTHSVFSRFAEAESCVNNRAKDKATCTKRFAEGSSFTSEKRSRLEDLYRPPLDLLFCGTFSAARDYATLQNRWLIVNLQDNSQFKSQIVNRDIWSSIDLKQIVQKHFVLWQVFVNNGEGLRFKSFYNVATTPYICVVDPRTGEEKQSFEVSTAQALKTALEQYLVDNSYELESDPTLVPAKKIVPQKFETAGESSDEDDADLGNLKEQTAADLSEDDQVSLAIRNSLMESALTENNEPSTSLGNDVIPYERFLGNQSDPMSIIQLRLPEGDRDKLEWPSSTKLLAIKLYAKWKYPELTKSPHKIISTFPQQNILELDENISLLDANLHPRAILYLHPDV